MQRTALKHAVRRGMLVIGIAGGITILGGGIAAASADETAPSSGIVVNDKPSGDQTSGRQGTGSGNQVDVDANAPVDASGNQVTVIGDENKSSGDGSEPNVGADPDAGMDVDHTDGEDGTLSGNQVEADVAAPVDASGNQVTVIGNENRSGGSRSPGDCQSSPSGEGDQTSGEDGVLSGNQVEADVDAPVDASGNQVTVIGNENRSGGSRSPGDTDGDSEGDSGGDETSGEDGTGSGNQLDPEASAPVDASGNQVTVIGNENQSGGSAENGGDTDGDSEGDSGGDEVAGASSGGPGRPGSSVLTGSADLAVAPVATLPQVSLPVRGGLDSPVWLCCWQAALSWSWPGRGG